MTSNGRVARLTALALATGTLVAAGASSASAATATQDVFDAGNAAGNGIIHIDINLPAGLSIPGLVGNHLTQDLVVTNSAVRTGAKPGAIANAVLGQNGNIVALSDLLKGSSTATLAQPNGTANGTAAPLSSLLGSVGLLQLKSTVKNPNLQGDVSHSLSSVADLHVGGDGVLNAVLKPVLDQINTVLGSLKISPASTAAGATAAPIATVTQGLSQITGVLDSITNNASAPVSDAVQAAVAQVQTLVNNLVAQLDGLDLASLGADSSLLDVGLIQSEQTVKNVGGTITSTVNNKLVGVKVLGGLISVDGLVSRATAALDKSGNPVSGSPAASGSLLQGNVADLLTANITNQIQVLLGGTVGEALGAAAVGQINAVLAQVTGLLKDVLGVSFAPPQVAKVVKQKNLASQDVAGALLTVDPLRAMASGGAPLLAISFVPASAKVVRAEGVAAPAPVTPPTTVTSLPRTGANLPLTGAIATALVGLALVARRRRMAHLAD
jgi:hypothetical protein